MCPGKCGWRCCMELYSQRQVATTLATICFGRRSLQSIAKGRSIAFDFSINDTASFIVPLFRTWHGGPSPEYCREGFALPGTLRRNVTVPTRWVSGR